MKRFPALLALLLLGGCQLGYYTQLARGNHALMHAREPVDQVLKESDLSPAVRHKLVLSKALRQFAADDLQLPVDDAYKEYVPLGRDWATWNLFAAPPFSLTPKTWCYPFVGCASYRGYFDKARASRDAEKLRQQGLEVYAAGSIAYSTLGWFDDPLTSTMLQGSDAWFAELLFHELTHRRFYLKGDTRFNESLATAVAREGLRRWLAQTGTADDLKKVARADAARHQVLAMVADSRRALAALYASDLPEAQMRTQRDALREALRQRYQQARAANPDLDGYRDWFAGPLNNAQLNTMSDYEGWVPGFDAILSRCHGDWPCFWQEVERIAKLPAEKRKALLETPDA